MEKKVLRRGATFGLVLAKANPDMRFVRRFVLAEPGIAINPEYFAVDAFHVGKGRPQAFAEGGREIARGLFHARLETVFVSIEPGFVVVPDNSERNWDVARANP